MTRLLAWCLRWWLTHRPHDPPFPPLIRSFSGGGSLRVPRSPWQAAMRRAGAMPNCAANDTRCAWLLIAGSGSGRVTLTATRDD